MKTNLSSLKLTAFAVGIFLSLSASAQFTAVQSGDWSSSTTWGGTAPSSTVLNQNITIPSNITVNLDMDVTFSGVLNSIMVNGVLSNTSSATGLIMTSGNLSGTGTVSIGTLKFSSLATVGYTGSLKIKHLVNSVSTLAFTSIADVMDTLELESGNISLNTNGSLNMMSGSTVKVNNGSLVINSGVFNSTNSYNVMYVGNSKNTGVEMNSSTIHDVHVHLSNSTQSVNLAGNIMVGGTLDLTMGILNINGKKLTLNGDLNMPVGSGLLGGNAADIEIGGSGSFNSAIMFSSGSTLHNLTINRTNNAQVQLKSTVSLSGTLSLMEGTLSVESNGNLTLMNTSPVIHVEKGVLAVNSGTFIAPVLYAIQYAGTTDISSGAELSGTGIKNVTVMFANTNNKVMLNDNLIVAGLMSLNSGKIDLNGKILMLNGNFHQSQSAWIIGNASSELHLNQTSVNGDTLYFDAANAGSQTLSKLTVNTTGPNMVMLGSKLIIANELNFTTGKLELGNGDLEIMSAASITGYDDTKYIVTSDNASGKLIQNVNSGSAYVTFPVGLASNYSPVYVQQTSSGTSGNFSVKCNTLYTTGLKAVNRVWMVEGAGVSTINANLRFGWKAAAEINSFDRTNAYVSHYTNNAWDISTSSSATAGVNSTYELSRSGLTSLSPFAVVEANQPLKVSELSKQLANIEVYPNPSKDVLSVKVLNNNDEYSYELIDVTGRTIMTASNANPINKFDVSNLGAGCYFIKVTNLSENQSTTKRFVKQ